MFQLMMLLSLLAIVGFGICFTMMPTTPPGPGGAPQGASGRRGRKYNPDIPTRSMRWLWSVLTTALGPEPYSVRGALISFFSGAVLTTAALCMTNQQWMFTDLPISQVVMLYVINSFCFAACCMVLVYWVKSAAINSRFGAAVLPLVCIAVALVTAGAAVSLARVVGAGPGQFGAAFGAGVGEFAQNLRLIAAAWFTFKMPADGTVEAVYYGSACAVPAAIVLLIPAIQIGTAFFQRQVKRAQEHAGQSAVRTPVVTPSPKPAAQKPIRKPAPVAAPQPLSTPVAAAPKPIARPKPPKKRKPLFSGLRLNHLLSLRTATYVSVPVAAILVMIAVADPFNASGTPDKSTSPMVQDAAPAASLAATDPHGWVQTGLLSALVMCTLGIVAALLRRRGPQARQLECQISDMILSGMRYFQSCNRLIGYLSSDEKSSCEDDEDDLVTVDGEAFLVPDTDVALPTFSLEQLLTTPLLNLSTEHRQDIKSVEELLAFLDEAAAIDATTPLSRPQLSMLGWWLARIGKSVALRRYCRETSHFGAVILADKYIRRQAAPTRSAGLDEATEPTSLQANIPSPSFEQLDFRLRTPGEQPEPAEEAPEPEPEPLFRLKPPSALAG